MKNASTLKKVLRYIRRYTFWLIMSVLLAAATVTGTLYIPIIAGNAIDCIVEGGVNFGEIFPLLIQAGIIAGATAFLQWLMNAINNKITFQVVRDLRGAPCSPLTHTCANWLLYSVA